MAGLIHGLVNTRKIKDTTRKPQKQIADASSEFAQMTLQLYERMSPDRPAKITPASAGHSIEAVHSTQRSKCFAAEQRHGTAMLPPVSLSRFRCTFPLQLIPFRLNVVESEELGRDA